MAYKLIWSLAARDDLHDIVVSITRDNPNRAMLFGYELISETDRLQEFPELGRTVPEYRDENIRESDRKDP
jgi:plasmid stabilization system protein ParE